MDNFEKTLTLPLTRTLPPFRKKLRIVLQCLLPVFFLFAATQALAQRTMSENQMTEQPGFYIPPYTIYPGNLQVESTLSLEQYHGSFENFYRATAIPNVLARYGLTDRLEVRLQTGLGLFGYHVQGFSDTDFGAMPVTVGGKVQVVDPGEAIPAIAFRAHFTIPELGYGPPDYLAPALLVTSSTPFLDDYTAFLNLGVAWNGFSPAPTYQYALAAERILVSNLTGYLELYGFIPAQGDLDHRYDLGVLYAFTPDLQGDLSTGIGFNGQVTSWFVAAGISFRCVALRNQ